MKTHFIKKTFLFGVVSYTRLNDVSMLKVFGRVIYDRVGNTKMLLGVSWRGNK